MMATSPGAPTCRLPGLGFAVDHSPAPVDGRHGDHLLIREHIDHCLKHSVTGGRGTSVQEFKEITKFL